MATPVFVFAFSVGFLCELCGFGCFFTAKNTKQGAKSTKIYTQFMQGLYIRIVIYYLITSICVGVLSSLIAIISYENWPGKGHEREFGPSTRPDYTLRY